MEKGVVYIVRNPNEPINTYKVGCSSKDAESRIRAGQTWSSTEFEILRQFSVSDCYAAEAAAHLALDSYRVRQDREIFNLDIDLLIAEVKKSIRPWMQNSENTNEVWLLEFLSENHRLCIDTNVNDRLGTFILELLMRCTSNPIGQSAEQRLVHDEQLSDLLKNDQLGLVLKNIVKNINLKNLTAIPHWKSCLSFLLKLDETSGPIVFIRDYPEILRDQRGRPNINTFENLKIKVRKYNINEIVDFWCKNQLVHSPQLFSYFAEVILTPDYKFLPVVKNSFVKTIIKYFTILDKTNAWEKLAEGDTERQYYSSSMFIEEMLNVLPALRNISQLHFSQTEEGQVLLKFKESQSLREREFQPIIDTINKKILQEIKDQQIEIIQNQFSTNLELSKFLFEHGKDSHVFFREKFNQKYKNSKYSSFYQKVNNTELVLFAQKNNCSLEASVEHFISEIIFSYDEAIRKKEIKKEIYKDTKEGRLKFYKEFWQLTSDQSHEIEKLRLTVKNAVNFKKNNKAFEFSKTYLDENDLLRLQQLKTKVKKYLKNINKRYGMMFSAAIDEKYGVIHITRFNIERIATISNFEGYRIWYFDQFPFVENKHFNNADELIQNCVKFPDNFISALDNESILMQSNKKIVTKPKRNLFIKKEIAIVSIFLAILTPLLVFKS